MKCFSESLDCFCLAFVYLSVNVELVVLNREEITRVAAVEVV